MTGKTILLAWLSIAFQVISATPFPSTYEAFKPKAVAASDPGYRIPSDFILSEYDLKLTPYMDTGDAKAFTFEGTVVISLTPSKLDINKIVMHSKDLDIENKAVVMMDPDGEIVKLRETDPLEFVPIYDFFIIHLGEELKEVKYTITIRFKGKLRDDMTGFYRSSYKEGNDVKWIGTTQFQPVHARKVFPCFDEPKYKAVFKITIIRPSSFQPTLSNMPIQTTAVMSPTSTSEQFYPTPKMSTYLIAFIVSEYKAAKQSTDKKFGVWARPGASEMGAYPFNIGQNLVKEMDKYIGIKYDSMDANMKMDQAAIPDFSAGAMENWGLLTYREAYLMVDEGETSARYRQQANGILAHEIAHMWFGDLVTCDWWSNTWLNEGFARFFQFRLPDLVDDTEMETQFTVAQLQTAFQVDTSISSVPLTNIKVNSPEEISAHFGSITYNKGAAVIKMMEHLIGSAPFKAGLTAHLQAKSYQTALPEDLFAALQKAADDAKALQNYAGSTIGNVMGSWTFQAGYPLVTVNIDYETGDMNITQERFVREEETVPKTLYRIPISFATKNSPMFNETKPQFIMDTKLVVKNKGMKGKEWVVFNKQQTGYYRVNYDDQSWMMLASTLLSPERTAIDTFNRAQIVDDVFNLAREKKINYTMMFDVIQFLQNETDYAPWSAGYAGFSFLRQKLTNVPVVLKHLERHMSVLMENVVADLGLVENSTDNHLRKLFRMNTLTLACQLGHEGCIETSQELFEKLKDKQVIVNPNLREHVYCNALRHGNQSHFQYLWNKYETENVVNEQIVILGALGCTKRAQDIITYLKQTIMPITSGNPKQWIRAQDVMTAFNSALTGNPDNVEHVFKFVQDNLAEMKNYYTSGNIQTAFANMALRMKPKHRDAFLSFLRKNKEILTTSEFESGVLAVINAGQSDLWGYEVSSEIQNWIALKYTGAGTHAVISVTLLFAALATLFYGN